MIALEKIGCLDVRIGVRLAHEAVTDHADSKFLHW
jgi:hypothetical protein